MYGHVQGADDDQLVGSPVFKQTHILCFHHSSHPIVDLHSLSTTTNRISVLWLNGPMIWEHVHQNQVVSTPLKTLGGDHWGSSSR